MLKGKLKFWCRAQDVALSLRLAAVLFRTREDDAKEGMNDFHMYWGLPWMRVSNISLEITFIDWVLYIGNVVLLKIYACKNLQRTILHHESVRFNDFSAGDNSQNGWPKHYLSYRIQNYPSDPNIQSQHVWNLYQTQVWLLSPIVSEKLTNVVDTWLMWLWLIRMVNQY